jgi:hypothetical protein
MPYFPVDDKLHSHRKAIRAGVAAMGLWVLAGSWASDHGTDGFVPDYVAERSDEKGWLFHEWTGDEMGRRNLTRAEIEQRRREGAERQARSRERRMGQNPDVTRDKRVTHASVTDDVTHNSHVSHTDPPHPTPPTPFKSQNQNQGGALSGSLPKKHLENGQIENQEHDDGLTNEERLRRRWRGVSCPEHRSPSIASCIPCGAEHKSVSYWTRHEYPSGAAK